MHFLDHARGWLPREAMLDNLGGTGCRCWVVLVVWRLVCSREIGLRGELPEGLKALAQLAREKHKDRRANRGNGQPPTFHGRIALRAERGVQGAMQNADYRSDRSRWVQTVTAVTVDLDWQLEKAEAKAETSIERHPKHWTWKATSVDFQIAVQPARYLMAQHRFGHHVTERGKLRVVLEQLPEHHELLRKPRPLDAVLVRAVRQSKGYYVRDCVAMLRSPKAGEKHWRLTRWLD